MTWMNALDVISNYRLSKEIRGFIHSPFQGHSHVQRKEVFWKYNYDFPVPELFFAKIEEDPHIPFKNHSVMEFTSEIQNLQ